MFCTQHLGHCNVCSVLKFCVHTYNILFIDRPSFYAVGHLVTLYDGMLGYKLICITCPVSDPTLFKLANQLAGRQYPDDVLSEGKKAIEFFKTQYGMDFSDASDDVILGKSNSTKYDGNVTLAAYNIQPNVFYRLISATSKDKATKFNNFVLDFGWYISVTQPFEAKGIVNRTLSPLTTGSYGYYAIRVGESAEEELKQAPFPGPVLVIDYHSRTFFVSTYILTNNHYST